MTPEWTAAGGLDLPEIATIRAIVPLPGGGVAVGSDYGVVVGDGHAWNALPHPIGARLEARRVEAMGVHDHTLHVATSRTWLTWPIGADAVQSSLLPRHPLGGYDTIHAFATGPDGLLIGRVTGNPPDVLALCVDPEGVVWRGTRHGTLHRDDEVVQTFTAPANRRETHAPAAPGRPVRHLALHDGVLHVAAAGAHHRFDGSGWAAEPGEPTTLAVDPSGRLWRVVRGRLDVGGRPIDLADRRPWCIAFTADTAWVGCVGGLLTLSLATA